MPPGDALRARPVCSEQRLRNARANQLDLAIDRHKRMLDDVGGEESCSSQSAVEVEFGQSCRKRETHADSDRTVERAGNNCGQTRLAHNLKRTGDATEWLSFDHDKVGRTGPCNGNRIARLAHALVRGNRNAHVLDALANLSEFIDAPAGLLDILQVELSQRVNGVLRLVDVPATICIHADAPLWPKKSAHFTHARDVIGERLGTFGDLDLDRAERAESGEHSLDLGHLHRRHRGVYADARANHVTERLPTVFVGSAEPVGCLIVVIFDEGRKLSPSLRTLDECGLAHGDTAELRGEVKRDDMGASEDIVEVGNHDVSFARTTQPATGLEARVGVQALEEDVHDREVKHDRTEAHHGENRRTRATPSARCTCVDVAGVDRPDDEGPNLFGVPAPVAAPRFIGPDSSGDESECPEDEADDDQAVRVVLECDGVGEANQRPKTSLLIARDCRFAALLQELHERETETESKEAGCKRGHEDVDNKPVRLQGRWERNNLNVVPRRCEAEQNENETGDEGAQET